MRRLAALALAGCLLGATAGCGVYGPPKRYPKVTQTNQPAAEQGNEPETVESDP